MSKAVYRFISYPESSNVEDIKKALDVSGYDWALSPLHDMDKKDDGSPKKPHYHWLLGFEKQLPGYFFLSEFLRSLGCVVPPAREFKCNMPEDDFNYLSHNTQNCVIKGKHIYNKEDVVVSENWDLSKYTTYTQKRISKTSSSAASVVEVLGLINEHHLYSLVDLVDWCMNENQELLGVISNKGAFFVAYIKDLCFVNEKIENLNNELDRYKTLYVQLSDLCEELQEENYQAVTALSRTYQNLTGEPVSPDMQDLLPLSRWIQSNVTKL